MVFKDYIVNHVNIFSLHYFLWFGALTSIYGYINVYAQHYANTNATQYGYLNSVLPFVTIFTKIYFCSLADRYRAHKSFFLAFLITALIGYGSFAALPYLISDTGFTDLRTDVWAIICIMTFIATISMSVISCLSDAFAMNSSKNYNVSYGRIRLWGTLGWGLMSIILSQINQPGILKFLVPGIILLIVLISIDIISVAIWPKSQDFELNRSSHSPQIIDLNTGLDMESNISSTIRNSPSYGSTEHDNTNSSRPVERVIDSPQPFNTIENFDLKTQWDLFKNVVIYRPSIIRYMTLTFISGALIALQWSYFFQFLAQVFGDQMSYVSSISMFSQSMLGELPFFLISNQIVNKIGRNVSLSISIITIAIRYVLYEYVVQNVAIFSYYGVILTEPLAGPNFGLFYVVMTEVGLDYSDCEQAIDQVIKKRNWNHDDENLKDRLRNSLRATMQGVMSACYEGLGVGIGSLIGGLVIDKLTFKVLWLGSASIAVLLGTGNLAIELFIALFLKKN